MKVASRFSLVWNDPRQGPAPSCEARRRLRYFASDSLQLDDGIVRKAIGSVAGQDGADIGHAVMYKLRRSPADLPRAPPKNGSISMSPLASALTASTNGFTGPRYSSARSEEKNVSFSFTGSALAASGKRKAPLGRDARRYGSRNAARDLHV